MFVPHTGVGSGLQEVSEDQEAAVRSSLEVGVDTVDDDVVPLVIPGVDLGTPSQEELDNLQVATDGQRCDAVPVPGVRGGALGQQQPHHVRVASLCCNEEWGGGQLS